MNKKYFTSLKNIVRLFPNDGACIVTDPISIDACEIGYMYREITERDGDTGWRFFSGDESQDYINNLNNSNVFSIIKLANYEPCILAYLDTPAPCEFERIPGIREFKRIK
jgi:hypothetical protein